MLSFPPTHLTHDLERFGGRPTAKSVCIVTAELVGPVRNGGIGTAFTALALALSADGHAVTVVYLRGGDVDDGDIQGWIDHYAALRVAVRPLQPGEALSRVVASLHPDIVHFHDWLGRAAEVIEYFRNDSARPLVAVHAHGPSEWVREANGILELMGNEAAVDENERISAAAADVLVSPSAFLIEWMRSKGWVLPRRVYVQQNIYPGSLERRVPVAENITELVFFGRLEPRKGFSLFQDALALLEHRNFDIPPVTYLGKATMSRSGPTVDAIRRGPNGAGAVILDTYDRDKALRYLGGAGRLAVVPSLSENSPYTVLECIVEGIPFVATAVGGIAELVHPDDRASVLVDPSSAALASRLSAIIGRPAVFCRPAVPLGETKLGWLRWHREVQVRPRHGIAGWLSRLWPIRNRSDRGVAHHS